MRKPVSRVRSLWALTVFALFSGCTGAGPSKGPGPTPSTTPSEVSPTASPAGTFVRTCQSNIYGDLGKDWRGFSVVIGPIAFVGLPGAATRPRTEFLPDKYGFKSVKALAVVDRGAEVTVTIPPSEQGHIALQYDPTVFDSRQLADGETTVTFRACAQGEGQWPGPTQFNGGFLVDGPQCAILAVKVGNGSQKGIDVAFGRGTCATG